MSCLLILRMTIHSPSCREPKPWPLRYSCHSLWRQFIRVHPTPHTSANRSLGSWKTVQTPVRSKQPDFVRSQQRRPWKSHATSHAPYPFLSCSLQFTPCCLRSARLPASQIPTVISLCNVTGGRTRHVRGAVQFSYSRAAWRCCWVGKRPGPRHACDRMRDLLVGEERGREH
jgi:hypothetical protein